MPFNALYNRSVNVNNNTLLITGGTHRSGSNSTLLKSSFLVSWDYNESSTGKFSQINNYTLLVREYAEMKEERSRHNIIFLPDKNAVFVCSTIDKKPNVTAEITYLNRKNTSWELIKPKLRESRGNATMAYISDRYIYCIAGFQYEGSKYLQSLEYIDTTTFDEWKYVDFNTNMTFKELGGKCTMGVIHIKNNDFVIFGGFDGSNSYCKDSYEVNFDNLEKPSINKIQIENMGDVNIFYSQSFLNVGEGKFVNFNLKCMRYLYDSSEKRLDVTNDSYEYNNPK